VTRRLDGVENGQFSEDDLRRAALQTNYQYIDYDVEASNGGLTASIRRSTAISSIDGKASVSPRRGSSLAAALALRR
jgi:hypothetical protein